jgi:DNA-binding NtrC family response regulator
MYTHPQVLESSARCFRELEKQPQVIAPELREQAMVSEGRVSVGRTLGQVECDLILDTLKHCLGNRTHAANILGISIRTLRNKLREYANAGLPIPLSGNAAGRDIRPQDTTGQSIPCERAP